MDQHSICLFPDRQWPSAPIISQQLIAVLGLGAIAYSSVTGYLSGLLWVPDKEARPIPGDPDAADQAILTALDEQPFSSVHNIAKRTFISETTLCG
jgi:hypothetical protein